MTTNIQMLSEVLAEETPTTFFLSPLLTSLSPARSYSPYPMEEITSPQVQ